MRRLSQTEYLLEKGTLTDDQALLGKGLLKALCTWIPTRIVHTKTFEAGIGIAVGNAYASQPCWSMIRTQTSPHLQGSSQCMDGMNSWFPFLQVIGGG